MATNHSERENTPVGRGLGYEVRDANINGLIRFAYWMAIVLAITLFGMKWTFDYFKKAEPLGATVSPLVKPTDRPLPPNPRLQVQPHQELVDYCQTQQEEVNTYGWVNQESGVVRIPVDRAMDIIVTRGLPARPASEAPAGTPSVAAATVAGGTDLQGPCGYLTEPEEAAKAEGADEKH